MSDQLQQGSTESAVWHVGNQRANHHTLPASPFDLPAPNPSAAPPPPALNLRNPYMGQMPPPATSTSAAGAVGKLDSFSFHPGAMGSARMGASLIFYLSLRTSAG